MIQAVIFRDNDGKCNGFHFSGHAGYDEHGYDIVCASVSMLVVNTINSIETFTDDHFICDVKEEDGDVDFHIEGDISKESTLLLDSMLLGIKAVEEDYGNEFIKIIEN